MPPGQGVKVSRKLRLMRGCCTNLCWMRTPRPAGLRVAASREGCHERHASVHVRSLKRQARMPSRTTSLIRVRWISKRPYAGHSDDSLRRKIQCDALADWAKAHARRELERRVQVGGANRFIAAAKAVSGLQG